MKSRVAGNTCLFCLFRTCNFFLILVGLGVITAGIYVAVDDKSFKWYNGSFIGLGAITVILAIIGHKSRYSQWSINIYIFLLGLTTAAMIGFTIGIIAFSNFSNIIPTNKANAVRYSLLCCSIIMVLTWVLAFCYRRSTNWALFYAKNTPSNKENNLPLVTPKTDEQRQKIKTKYGQLNQT